MIKKLLREWFALPSPSDVHAQHSAKHGRELAELRAQVEHEGQQQEILHLKRLQNRLHNARIALQVASEELDRADRARKAHKLAHIATLHAFDVAIVERDEAEDALRAYRDSLLPTLTLDAEVALPSSVFKGPRAPRGFRSTLD